MKEKWKNKMDNQQGPTVYTGNSGHCYVAAWTRGEFGGEWRRVCMAESFWSPPETTETC